MAKILEEVTNLLPKDVKISDIVFEGANIVIYTKDKEFFLNNNGTIREIVDSIKKRVELRPDPSLCMGMEKAEETIKKIIPEDAKVANILFDAQRSVVVIEAEKPGLAIGKSGETLKEIKQKTLWVPTVQRTPSIRSKIIENIRQVLYEESDYRRKFLHNVGKRIYDGWVRGKKEEWVRVTMLGAGREVGRSCILLQTAESRVLLDCGVNVAANSDDYAYPMLEAPEFDLKEIDAVVISHSHTDHIGFLPYLFKYGYKGPVYMTAPTRDVGALLLLDYIGIQQKEAKKALFSSADIKELVKHTICLDYEEVSDITPDIRLTFYNAGHTLGSAMVHLHIGNGLHNFVYAADFNYETSNLLAKAVTKFPRLETIMIEGTYGSKDDIMPTRKESEDYLIQIANNINGKDGKVLMPVLGVGRSQEIMLILERAMREGRIKQVPIYIQGMVWDITAIHTAYPDFFNPKVKKSIFHKDHNPFLSDFFKYVGSQKEMQEVIEKKEACIIMATSGMMTGGASVEYFKALAENKDNALILTCYQGQGSLGRRVQEGEKEIGFQNGNKVEMLKVNMEIHTIHGFSGHSDRRQLLSFVYNLDPKPKKVLVNHGESSKCLDLASSVHKLNRIETNAPKNLESIRLR